MASYSVTITQGLGLGETVPVGSPYEWGDVFAIQAVPFPTRGWVLVQGIAIHPVPARQYKAGGLITQAVVMRETVGARAHYIRMVSEQLHLHARMSIARAVHLVQGLSLHDLRVVRRALHVIQGLSLLAKPSASAHYHLALVQSLRMRTGLARFLGGQIVTGFSMHDTAARSYTGVANLIQALHVHDVDAGYLLFRFDLAEGIEIDPAQVLRTIYRGDHLVDGINLWVAYVDPGGGFTTWAINTRTGAVTEYLDYVFNSIARIGHRFLGADSDGLWELDGELDDTAPISTRIKSGWMQVSGTKYTSFKAAYLGLRIKDDATDFILKLHAGDGREYIYAVKPKDMQTTKVHMGKGLRARYFSFELVTSGADYDLDSIEFVPISSTRRV